MTPLWMAVEQTFGLAILLALPLAIAAAVGAVASGLVASWTGLQDATISLVARMLTVVVALSIMSSVLVRECSSLTAMLWSELVTVGQAP